MSGWKRIVRGMIGTGVVFGAVTGAATLVVGVAAMIFGNASLNDLRFAGRVGVAGFILGVGFSGMLALAARNRRFTELSVPKFAGIGAIAGLIYFLFISTNGIGVWSLETAIFNFLLLVLMGSGAATATLLVARRARAGLNAPEELDALGEGNAAIDANASSFVRESVRRN